MQVTIDRVGRIVIPKRLRDLLGIGPDTDLEVTVDGAALRLEPVRQPERPIEVEDGLPLLARVKDLRLTDADVRQLRDDVQR